MKLHPKILELRNKVGSAPIHHFYSTRAVGDTSMPEVEDDEDELPSDRLIKQYFCIFGVPDDYGTIPVKGCFAKSIEERGPNSKSNYKITVLWQHDEKDPLCIPTVLKEDEIGLYAEYSPDPIPSGDRCLIQVRSGTINNGSYGFNYIWDKMEYNEKTDMIMMHEVALFEISPVTRGSQTQTYVKRNANGIFEDKFLLEETEDLIKQLPRKHHLELRNLINRHISLAQSQPLDLREKALENDKPTKAGLDYDYLISKL